MTPDNHEGSMEELGYRKRVGPDLNDLVNKITPENIHPPVEISSPHPDTALADELAKVLKKARWFKLNEPMHFQIEEALQKHANARKQKEEK